MVALKVYQPAKLHEISQYQLQVQGRQRARVVWGQARYHPLQSSGVVWLVGPSISMQPLCRR
jgi:hypothetical protein